VTHTAVLRAVIDYVQLALRGEGRITLADAPLQGCDFDALLRRGHISELQDHYQALARAGQGVFRPLPLAVLDLRLEVASPRAVVAGIAIAYDKTRRQETGRHAIVELGAHSALEPIACDCDEFRVTCYDPDRMREAHRPGHHVYCVSREVLEADVVINVAKLKTHKKGGLTVALKNLVGINGHKSYLPHHRRGSTDLGGDEYLARDRLKDAASRLHDVAYRIDTPPWRQRLALLANAALGAVGRMTREEGTETGCWYGNDTLWRTCLDLNLILLYADSEGCVRGGEVDAEPARRVFHVVDGIVGGDGDGPLAPRPRDSGVVMVGVSAPFVDLAAATLMGLAWERIPLVHECFVARGGAPLVRGRPEDLRIVSNVAAWHGTAIAFHMGGLPESLRYRPAPGWEAVLAPDLERPGAVPLVAAVRRAGLLWRIAPRRHAVP
jgi:hypothetical protein